MVPLHMVALDDFLLDARGGWSVGWLIWGYIQVSYDMTAAMIQTEIKSKNVLAAKTLENSPSLVSGFWGGKIGVFNVRLVMFVICWIGYLHGRRVEKIWGFLFFWNKYVRPIIFGGGRKIYIYLYIWKGSGLRKKDLVLPSYNTIL